METNETFRCKSCGQDTPRREGRVFDTWLGTCRYCRQKDYMKQYMQTKRDDAQLKVRLAKREERDVRFKDRVISKIEAVEAKTQHARLKAIKSQFLKATAVTRNRIKIMERDLTPLPKTVKALEVRRRLLSRYEEAYKCQVEVVKRGSMPPHIEDLIQE